MSTSISKMTREELEAEAARLGIEGVDQIPTIKELRSLIAAYAEQTGDSSEDDERGPDASGSPQGDEPGNSDAGGVGGGEGTPHSPEASPGFTARGTDELPNVPAGCVIVHGLGPTDRCAFFEQERRHPDGEVFVRGGEFAIAYPTSRLMRQVGRTLSLVEQAGAGEG
jgi:hypothetical protein